MVKLQKRPYHNEDGSLNIELWLDTLSKNYPKEHLDRVRQVIDLAINLGEHVPALSPQDTCLDLGLQMAALLGELSADETTLIAALMYHLVLYADFNLEDIEAQIGSDVSNLISGALRMDEISTLLHAQNNTADNLPSRIHNLRKMLLAMAKDVRVVILKLSEKLCHLRAASHLDSAFKKRIATEVKEIYAPLTNRLGLGHLKWEMEDSVFRYLEEDKYKELANALHQKRIEREEYIAHFQESFNAKLQNLELSRYELAGRAKHLYSIYKKMLRKNVGLEKIYDSFAVRVLVPEIPDCYQVLSLVHEAWTPIPEEFDDYIAKPKGNGYQSLHTAVIGPDNKNVEVQIRTFEMHQVSELGVAAHWKYKEGGGSPLHDYEDKIAWLRQLIAWQSDYLHQDNRDELFQTSSLFDDRVYVFTPEGDIIDLKKGATPIDFAYHVHSEVGHRCKGAKINDKIVPLSYTLKTGDRVSIITAKNAHPSLDWLDPKAAFVVTSKARAKILQWFNAQNYQENVAQGTAILNEAAKREHLKLPPLLPIATALYFRSIDDMFAALGGGAIKLAHIVSKITQPSASAESTIPIKAAVKKPSKSDISVYGLNDILHTIAKCCKPIPGDPIVGFITQQRGITVHHQHCRSLEKLPSKERIIAVDWRDNNATEYTVELRIMAYPKQELIKDITALISQEKIHLTRIHSTQNDHTLQIDLLISVKSAEHLKHFMQLLGHMPEVSSVQRLMAT